MTNGSSSLLTEGGEESLAHSGQLPYSGITFACVAFVSWTAFRLGSHKWWVVFFFGNRKYDKSYFPINAKNERTDPNAQPSAFAL